ncbi:PspC domain-containing protein [Pueribacillus sp. YX66]
MKSSKDKSLFGVCGEIAEYFGISPFLIRLIFIEISFSSRILGITYGL